MFTIFTSLVSFGAGYYLGISDDKAVRNFFKKLLATLKDTETDIREAIVDFLDQLENLDSDEIKANIGKFIDIFKDKFDEFLKNEKLNLPTPTKAKIHDIEEIVTDKINSKPKSSKLEPKPSTKKSETIKTKDSNQAPSPEIKPTKSVEQTTNNNKETLVKDKKTTK